MTAVSLATHPGVAYHGQVNGRAFKELTTGQIINVQVLRKVDEQHYVVALRGEVKEVQADHSLPVGQTIDAAVVSTTGRIELRQVAADRSNQDSVNMEVNAGATPLANALDEANVASQAQFYKCDLSNAELRTLQRAVNSSADPTATMLAGLFLNKRGIKIEPESLRQLMTLQLNEGTEAVKNAVAQKEIEPVLTVGDLAQAMRSVVDMHAGEIANVVNLRETRGMGLSVDTSSPDVDAMQSSPMLLMAEQQSTGGANQDEGDSRKPITTSALHDLLSDVDTTGLGVRYGTLPVLINGELVELELVMFKHRQKETGAEPVKRLVMSIHTQSMGTVSISAESLDQRLLLNISAPTVEHAETLGAYAQDVKTLAQRFGWTVNSVAYDVKPHGVTLARKVMEHSVRQGAIDHVW